MSTNKQEFSMDEDTRAYMRASFDRGLARYNAGPAEVFLVSVGQEPASPQAASLDTVFAVWEQTPKKFCWFEKDIGESAEVVAATIFAITFRKPLGEFQPVNKGELDGCIYKARLKKTGEELYLPFSNHLGCFWIDRPANSERNMFFLYIGDVRERDPFKDLDDFPSRGPSTLYQFFRQVYADIARVDMYDENGEAHARLFGYCYDKHRPKRFSTLAKRSINRRRKVNLRKRARILDRDRMTCQVCGRSAPNVRLVVDHRVPVAHGGSNDDSNLWTLCEDCNLGKSDLPLFVQG